MTSQTLSYVLITPARNEEAFIEKTIESVVRQTTRPLKWVIVSDGSTDKTEEIVTRYLTAQPWIELVRRPPRQERNFAGKVAAFNAGQERMKGLPYDCIGSLDADISFAPNYFEFLLAKLRDDKQLGLVGTPFSEGGATYDYRFSSRDHVSGACQLFRRQCFEDIGGYVAARGGGIDVIAVLTARSKGWTTRTFTEMHCEHHRPMGSANEHSRIMTWYRLGERQYRLGFHPLWQTLRAGYQMAHKPYVLGGGALFAGYLSALLRRMEKPIGEELVRFQRRDQMRRLRKILGRG